MANGNKLSDFLAKSSSPPGPPSLEPGATEIAFNWRTDLNKLEVWDGSAYHFVGGGGLNVVLATADYTMLDTDDVVIVQGGSALSNLTVTLPPASGTVKPRTIIPIVSPGNDTIVAATSGDQIRLVTQPVTYAGTLVISGSDVPWQDGMAFVFANGFTHSSIQTWSMAQPVPAGMNATNLVSRWSWEQAIGSVADELALLGARTHRLAYPRHPWSPDSSSAWYAEFGSTPGAWTLDSGIVVTYPPNGYAKVTQPNDTTERKMVAPLTGSGEFDVIFRFANVNASDGGWTCYLGMTAVGDRSDLDGLSINPNGSVVPYESGSGGISGVNTFTGGAAPGSYLWAWVKLASGTLTVRVSRDGMNYATIYNVASGLVPTHVVISMLPQVSVEGEDFFALDFVALGNSTPAGQ